jgi:PhzF family phenazine biosynthesis protein
MKRYIYKKSDAFTSGNSLGNPAACIYTGPDTLTGDEMQNIAAQHKGFVSEMVFCSDSEKADCKLTYYSSECEVAFCGHGTIAAMYELLAVSDSLRSKREILIETNRKGLLTLINEIENEDAVYITAPEAKKYNVDIPDKKIAEALGIKASDLDKRYPLALIDAGLKTLIVPISALQCEIGVFPCMENLKSFCLDNNTDIVLIFCMETSRPEFMVHTRVFAPKFGYLEDPATGSGNSALAYYLKENGLWDGSPAMIEQGGNDRLYNTVRIRMKDDKVLFGGKATIRIDGYYMI